MAERKYVHGLSVRLQEGTAVVSVGKKKFWDGADLSLLRDAISGLIQSGATFISVDLAGVQHIPSGFFGQVMDWSDSGVSIELMAPHERVRQMVWFREFFDLVAVDRYGVRQSKDAVPHQPDRTRTGTVNGCRSLVARSAR